MCNLQCGETLLLPPFVQLIALARRPNFQPGARKYI